MQLPLLGWVCTEHSCAPVKLRGDMIRLESVRGWRSERYSGGRPGHLLGPLQM